ncbi:uncharacterized protein LOC135225492 [Macrobrachium nipponense]|uniref:uncharacterized protein LOC135225492 n=1 Tax=Macrobrachium nipponense TaxID=159736 RepID=UPI0030C7F924
MEAGAHSWPVVEVVVRASQPSLPTCLLCLSSLWTILRWPGLEHHKKLLRHQKSSITIENKNLTLTFTITKGSKKLPDIQMSLMFDDAVGTTCKLFNLMHDMNTIRELTRVAFGGSVCLHRVQERFFAQIKTKSNEGEWDANPLESEISNQNKEQRRGNGGEARSWANPLGSETFHI